MNAFALLGFSMGISTFAIGVFILVKGYKKIHYLWAFFCFAVSVWGFGGYKIGNALTPEAAIFWWRVAYMGVIYIPTIYTHFVLEFLGQANKRNIIAIYSVSAFFFFFNVLDGYFINNVRYVFNEFYYISKPTLLYNLFVTYYAGILIYDLFILLQRYKKERGYYKLQIKYFLIVIFACFIPASFAYLPVYRIDIYPYLNIVGTFLALIYTYAIFKHKLMDISIIIQRGIIYSIILGLIIGVYVSLIFVLGFFFQQATDATILLAAGLTTVIGIYSAPQIEKYFRKFTNKIFFKDRYVYSEAVYELSEILNHNINLEILLRETVRKLKAILKTKSISISLFERNITYDENEKIRPPREYLPLGESLIKLAQYLNTSVLICSEIPALIKSIQNRQSSPDGIKELLERAGEVSKKLGVEVYTAVQIDNNPIGLLILGEKLSGDIYTSEDVNLLKTFSYQLAIALEKARLYEQAKNYSVELEKKVEKRTAELKSLQEEQKQMMLEIAHGLQTPLTIIKSELSLLEKGKQGDSKIISMERTIDRTSKFIYDMLRLAKLESEDGALVKEKINLSRLLIDLVEEFNIITAERNINLNNAIEPDIFILGNQSSLEELVTNLVSNSVKYIKDSKTKEITINLAKAEGHTELLIADTGMGINKEDIKHLFERFYRAKNGRGSKKRGTGLGLAISKKIVEMHGGKIKVESRVGKGTKFIIKFPSI